VTHSRVTYVLLALAVYLLLVLPAIWPPFHMGLVPVSLVYLIIALSISLQVTDDVLSLFWRRRVPDLKESTAPLSLARVAVLMTICNDCSEWHIAKLQELVDSDYQVYVLDDSDMPLTPQKGVPSGVVVVRRETRCGAKGGNLNHWLWRFGDAFDYAIILDSDSYIPVVSADKLVRTAHHPENCNVAIFQCMIQPRPVSGTIFERALLAQARPRMRILKRVHDSIGLSLSFGHNQLVRLNSVRLVGGFEEHLSNEDTVLSLRLAASGFSTRLLDLWSYDTEPADLDRYTRRTRRWACQTMELFSRRWTAAPVGLKFLLCRHLLTYLFPILATFLLAISIWTSPVARVPAQAIFTHILFGEDGFESYSVRLWIALGALFLSAALRLVNGVLAGVSLKEQGIALIFGSAPYAGLIAPLSIGMLKSALGMHAPFVPTNAREPSSNRKHVERSLAFHGSGSLLVGILWLGAIFRPGSFFVGFNALWLTWLLISVITAFGSGWPSKHLALSSADLELEQE
jgi:Glycosyl transferase family group 2